MDALDILVAKADKDARKSSVRQTEQNETKRNKTKRNETKRKGKSNDLSRQAREKHDDVWKFIEASSRTVFVRFVRRFCVCNHRATTRGSTWAHTSRRPRASAPSTRCDAFSRRSRLELIDRAGSTCVAPAWRAAQTAARGHHSAGSRNGPSRTARSCAWTRRSTSSAARTGRSASTRTRVRKTASRRA
eukprot:COSAG06_NODE_186_length_20792_cov_1041.487443_20_plen_189_part_00